MEIDDVKTDTTLFAIITGLAISLTFAAVGTGMLTPHSAYAEPAKDFAPGQLADPHCIGCAKDVSPGNEAQSPGDAKDLAPGAENK